MAGLENCAEALRLLFHVFDQSGPMIPSGKPGKFSTSVVSVSWPPASGPSDDEGLQVGAGGVDGGGVAGAAGADNQNVEHKRDFSRE